MDFFLVVSAVLCANALTAAFILAIRDVSGQRANRPFTSLFYIVLAAGIAVGGAYVFLGPATFAQDQSQSEMATQAGQCSTDDPFCLRDVVVPEGQ